MALEWVLFYLFITVICSGTLTIREFPCTSYPKTFGNIWLDQTGDSGKLWCFNFVVRVPNSWLPKRYKEVFIKLGCVLFENFSARPYFVYVLLPKRNNWTQLYKSDWFLFIFGRCTCAFKNCLCAEVELFLFYWERSCSGQLLKPSQSVRLLRIMESLDQGSILPSFFLLNISEINYAAMSAMIVLMLRHLLLLKTRVGLLFPLPTYFCFSSEHGILLFFFVSYSSQGQQSVFSVAKHFQIHIQMQHRFL